jgi:hypothetical protein
MLVPPTNAPIFIGYRRDDTGHAAGRLRDSLTALGHDVWFDLDKVKIASPYRSRIITALKECEVALILIGPQWATLPDRDGGRRIDDPDDDVRMEVQLALQRPDITLVPVLVDSARMPGRDEMPPDLREICELSGAPLMRDTWPHCVKDLHETIQRTARRGWRAWGEALLVAAAAAVPAAIIAAADGLRTSTTDLSASSNLTRLAIQRAELWALIMGAVLAWVALRRPGHRWGPALRAGLLWGALFGVLGAVVHAIPTYFIDRDTWLGWGVTDASVDAMRIAAYALGIGVTGAGVGALVGAAWNPPGIVRGLLAGFVTGGLLGWLVRTNIGGEDTQTKILTSILVAVSVVGVTVATEWLSRAATTGRGSA